MLIGSPRLAAADLAAWERLERHDLMLSRDPRLDGLAARAQAVMEEFAAAGPCFASVSWGKDSVVVAHLAAGLVGAGRVRPEALPLAHARPDRMDSPETPLVRDAFLARFPGLRYAEETFSWRVPLKGEPGWHPGQRGQDALREALGRVQGGRYASGTRQEESPARKTAMVVHGDATARTCRPIGRWTTAQVFAYLARHGLPVHPAYAMSEGGTVRRERLRVHWLGTDVGDLRHELRYYPDVFAAQSLASPEALAFAATL